MKQEDKELLLRDLSARLPYGVYCYLSICTHTPYKLYAVFNNNYTRDIFDFGTLRINPDIIKVKPYLRPMSSVTAGEAIELYHITEKCEVYPMAERGFRLTDLMSDFCNKHHLDYRGLIPKGIALVAKEGMYKFE